MVKVVIGDSQGLVQSAGSGLEVNSTTMLQGASTVRGDQSYASVSGGTVVSLRCKRETIDMGNGTTQTDTAAGFIPANALVVACGITLATAGAGGNHPVNVTDWGTDSDDDFFNTLNGGGTAYATNAAVGTAKVGCCDSNAAVSDGQTAAAQFFASAAKVRVKHGNVGTQTTACQLHVDLWYYDLSATTGS